MNTVLLSTLIGAATAAPCYPNTWKGIRHEFIERNNTLEFRQEWHSYAGEEKAFYRGRAKMYFDTPTGRQEGFFDVIMNATAKAEWRVQEIGNQITCTKHPLSTNSYELLPRCLLPNSTMLGAYTVAGSVLEEIWAETRHYGGNQMTGYYHFTAGFPIPVERNTWFEFNGKSAYEHVTYLDVSTEVSMDDFRLPSICQA